MNRTLSAIVGSSLEDLCPLGAALTGLGARTLHGLVSWLAASEDLHATAAHVVIAGRFKRRRSKSVPESRAPKYTVADPLELTV